MPDYIAISLSLDYNPGNSSTAASSSTASSGADTSSRSPARNFTNPPPSSRTEDALTFTLSEDATDKLKIATDQLDKKQALSALDDAKEAQEADSNNEALASGDNSAEDLASKGEATSTKNLQRIIEDAEEGSAVRQSDEEQ